MEVGALELAFDDLDFTKGAQERRRLLETALPATEADPATGGVPTVVDLLAGWVEQLGQEILDHQLSISGHPSLAVQDGLFRIGARGDAPAQEIRFGDFTADLGTVTSHAFDAGVDMESGFAAAIAGLRYAMDGGHAQAELSTAEVNARSVRLRATREETSLNFDLDVLLRQLAASADRGQSLDLDRLSLTTDSFVIKETSQGGTATGPVSLSLSDLAAGLPGPDGLLSLRGEGLDMALSPLTVTDAQGELVGFPGTIDLRGLALERGGDRPLSGSLASMRTELREMQVAPLDAQAEFTGGLTTTLAELRLEAGQGADAVGPDELLGGQLGHVRHGQIQVQAISDGGLGAVGGTGGLDLGGHDGLRDGKGRSV